MDTVSFWTMAGFGTLLIALSVLLSWTTESSWKKDEQQELNETDWNYLYTRRRRRLQTNIMISMVGAAIIVGIWIVEPLWFGIYWCCVVLLVVWILALAGLDFLATRSYYRQLRGQATAERQLLEQELHRLQQSQHNGNGTPQKRHG